MMHCCFDRTGRRIRSERERERKVKIGEYYIKERGRRKRDMGWRGHFTTNTMFCTMRTMSKIRSENTRLL